MAPKEQPVDRAPSHSAPHYSTPQYSTPRRATPNPPVFGPPTASQSTLSQPVPSRGRLTAIFAGLAALGLLIGVGASQLTGSGDRSAQLGAEPLASSTDIPSETPTDPDPQQSTEQPTGTSSAGPSQTPPAATSEPDYRPILEDTSTEPDLDFGYLIRVVNLDGSVTLRFDRASFYTGEAAKKRNGGVQPETDYLIENTNPALRSFDLDPQASITATNRLLGPDQSGRQTLTVAEFVQNSTRVLTGSITDLPVWVRHTDGLSGPVTALSEQYLP